MAFEHLPVAIRHRSHSLGLSFPSVQWAQWSQRLLLFWHSVSSLREEWWNGLISTITGVKRLLLSKWQGSNLTVSWGGGCSYWSERSPSSEREGPGAGQSGCLEGLTYQCVIKFSRLLLFWSPGVFAKPSLLSNCLIFFSPFFSLLPSDFEIISVTQPFDLLIPGSRFLSPIFLPVFQKPGLYFNSSQQPQIKALHSDCLLPSPRKCRVPGSPSTATVPGLRVQSPVSRVEREFQSFCIITFSNKIPDKQKQDPK